MNGKLKFIIAILFIVAISIPLSSGLVLAESNDISRSRDMGIIEIVEMNDTISDIENILQKKGTNIISALEKQKEEYLCYFANCEEEEKEQIRDIIVTTDSLINDYKNYQNRNIMKGKYHGTYSPLVAAAISYFNANNCKLAAELLTHAKDNDTYLSFYSPKNINEIEETETFTAISNGNEISGNGIYSKSESEDLYYALRRFSYTKTKVNSRTVTINDVYDFAPNNGDGFEGTILDSMYKAQEYGVIVPFNVEIKINPTTEVMLIQDEDNSYGEHCETFFLNKGEKRTFTLHMGMSTYSYFLIANANHNAYIKVKDIFNGQEETKILMTNNSKSVSIENNDLEIGMVTYSVEIGFVNIFDEGNIYFEACRGIVLN